MSDLSDKDTDILRLVAALRQMDQKIYRMSQCMSWPQMQPIFAELLGETMGRMQDESRRIQTLLIPEIRKAYLDAAPPPPSPQPECPRLERSADAGPPRVSLRRWLKPRGGRP